MGFFGLRNCLTKSASDFIDPFPFVLVGNLFCLTKSASDFIDLFPFVLVGNLFLFIRLF